VTGERLASPTGQSLPGPGKSDATDAAKPFRGLWVGTVRVDQVAEVNRDPDEVTATRSPFPLRLLVHVDANGQARLLKEVIQLWEDGVYQTRPDGSRIAVESGRYVLVTVDSLIGRFEGAGVRDGVPVGKRISSAGFDFDGGPQNLLSLTGVFAPGNRVAGRLDQAADSPTNPFKHGYHPGHDNLDVRFEPITDSARQESFAVRREIELDFSDIDPAGGTEPAYGYDVIGGGYRETISGLHKRAIQVQGKFRLRRLTEIAELNPEPRP
jgi:hypothetical protein